MILTLNGEINFKTLNKLIDYTNSAQKNNDLLTIYLDSPGGNVSVYLAMLDIINANKENIHLVGHGQLMSAAFRLFFEVTCTKELLPFTIGMAHFTWTTIDINNTGGPTKDGMDELMVKEMKAEKPHLLKLHKEIGLNEQELKKFSEGKDVWFTYKRMKELLNGSKVK